MSLWRLGQVLSGIFVSFIQCILCNLCIFYAQITIYVNFFKLFFYYFYVNKIFFFIFATDFMGKHGNFFQNPYSTLLIILINSS